MVTISPTSAASAPSGWDRNAASPRVPLPARRRRRTCPRWRRRADRCRATRRRHSPSARTGSRSSSSSTPRPQAWASSLHTVPTPPRVASRIHRVDGAAAISNSTNGLTERGVGGDVGLDGQVAAREHDRHAVIAHRPRQQHLVPGAHRRGRQRAARGDDTGPGGGDEQPVGRALGHHLGVAGDDLHDRRPRRPRPCRRRSPSTRRSAKPSSSTNAAEIHDGTAPATARSLQVPCTASSPIEPPGKRLGCTTNESVRHRHALSAGQREDRAVAERLEQRVTKRLDEHRVHQRRRGLAARAVRQGHMVVEQPGAAPAERLDPLDHVAFGEPRPRRTIVTP